MRRAAAVDLRAPMAAVQAQAAQRATVAARASSTRQQVKDVAEALLNKVMESEVLGRRHSVELGYDLIGLFSR